MARYRTKDDVDLRWNSIRRRITSELDVQIKEWREAALNKLLTGAWERYAKQLERGEVKVLESHFEQFVAAALDEVIGMGEVVSVPEPKAEREPKQAPTTDPSEAFRRLAALAGYHREQ